jgi:hypothetical protein
VDLEFATRRFKKQLQSLKMEEEHQEGPIDEGKIRFVLMVALEKKIDPFLEKLKSHGKLDYHEESRKEKEEQKLEKGNLVTNLLNTCLKWKRKSRSRCMKVR